MPEFTSVSVDVSYSDDADLARWLLSVLRLGFSVMIVEQSGPSGWPVVEITGDSRNLRTFLSQAGYDVEELGL